LQYVKIKVQFFGKLKEPHAAREPRFGRPGTFDSNSFLLNHPLCWHYQNCSVLYVTNNIVVHVSQFGSC